MSPGVKTYQICFSKRYRKLDPLKLQFTTVRWLDSFYRLGKVYEIFYVVPGYHRKIHLGSARLIKLEIDEIQNLSDLFTHNDADCSWAEFLGIMKGWYEQKPGWKGAESEIQILTLMRCFQVNEYNIQEGIKKTLVKQEPLEVYA